MLVSASAGMRCAMASEDPNDAGPFSRAPLSQLIQLLPE